VDKQSLIDALGLQAHVEGGYFRRSFQADHRARIDTDAGPRLTLTSIYYLLTDDSPLGGWHRNRSDILHYYHLGSPVSYYMIHPDGRLETAVLGPDLAAGECLQLAVRGGVWKAAYLQGGEYGLLSEAVAPGFEYEDMTLGEAERMVQAFPRHRELIERFSPPRDRPPRDRPPRDRPPPGIRSR
jgi:predicted cupin superfamily sugar epimerase